MLSPNHDRADAGAERVTVLIVDDDPTVRRSVARLIRSAGIEARTFTSPTEFLRHELPDGPACVLLDLSMPECDGPTTLRRFKQEFPQTRSRFILLSGDPDRAEPAHHPHVNGTSGFHCTIAKPFELDTFVDLVRREYAVKAAEDADAGRPSNTAEDPLSAPLPYRS